MDNGRRKPGPDDLQKLVEELNAPLADVEKPVRAIFEDIDGMDEGDVGKEESSGEEEEENENNKEEENGEEEEKDDAEEKAAAAKLKAQKELYELVQKRADMKDQVGQIEKAIYNYEGRYLEESDAHGNIVKGWEQYRTVKKLTPTRLMISRKRDEMRRPIVKPKVREGDRVFSNSSVTSAAVVQKAEADSSGEPLPEPVPLEKRVEVNQNVQASCSKQHDQAMANAGERKPKVVLDKNAVASYKEKSQKSKKAKHYGNFVTKKCRHEDNAPNGGVLKVAASSSTTVTLTTTNGIVSIARNHTPDNHRRSNGNRTSHMASSTIAKMEPGSNGDILKSKKSKPVGRPPKNSFEGSAAIAAAATATVTAAAQSARKSSRTIRKPKKDPEFNYGKRS